MSGTGKISAEDAISHGITGPFLRERVDYDVRKDCPYAVYDRLQFDVPIGPNGDNFDRFLVRMEEMRQSIRIIEQALRDIPPGPVLTDPETGRSIAAAAMVDQAKAGEITAIADAHAVTDPTLDGSARPLQASIAARETGVAAGQGGYLRQHRGADAALQACHVRPWCAAPQGRYFPVEGANGELGFYVVSDGADAPYCFFIRIGSAQSFSLGHELT